MQLSLKGEIQVKGIDANEELKKVQNSIIKVPLIFNGTTSVGPIDLGDKFSAYVSGNALNPTEGIECEKRLVKSFIGRNN